MQENSFEKRVRQKMDELHFEPSVPVWQKVAAQLPAKKRRRRLLLVLLPLLLMAGGAGTYFLIYKNDFEASIATTNGKDDTATEKGNNKAATKKEPPQKTANNAKISNEKTSLQKKKETFVSTTGSAAKRKNKRFKNELEPKLFLNGIKKESLTTEPDDLHALVLQNEMARKENAPTQNISNPFYPKLDSSKLAQADLATIQKNIVQNSPTQSDTTMLHAIESDSVNKVETITAAAEKPLKGKTNVWRWGVQLRGGLSGLRSSMADVFAQERAADFYAAPVPNSGSSSGAPPAAPAVPHASRLRNGASFSIGATVQRGFGSVWAVAGLQYSYYSTASEVGASVVADTVLLYNGRAASISQYYRNSGAATPYTTRYHYVALPLAIEYKLHKKWPVHLQHGVSLSRLVHTNALYLHRSAQVLYRSDAWLRKTHLHLFTAVDYRWLQRGPVQAFAGPHLQWGLTPVQQQKEEGKHYLFFAGLQTRILF